MYSIHLVLECDMEPTSTACATSRPRAVVNKPGRAVTSLERVTTREQLRARIAQTDREIVRICPFDREDIVELIRQRAFATGTELREIAVRLGWKSEAVRSLLLSARALQGFEPERAVELARQARIECMQAGLEWEAYEADRVEAGAALALHDIETVEELTARA